MTSVCVGILAGGQSQRMGSDKAALRIVVDGQPITLGERATAIARSITSDVVALGHGRHLDASLPRLVDVPDGQGPCAGVAALLASDRAQFYVVMPVDMPRLRPHDVRRLLQVLEQQNDVMAVHYEMQPLPCALRAGAAVPHHGALGRAWQALFARTLTPDDASALVNVNTPDDVARLAPGL